MPITFTLKQSAEESGLCVRTLCYAIANGDLESVRVGRRRLIPVRALEKFLLRGGGRGSRAGASQEVPRKKLGNANLDVTEKSHDHRD